MFSYIWKQIKKPALKAVLWIVDNIIEPIATFFATMLDGIVTMYNKVKNALKKALGTAVNFITQKVINPIIQGINKVGQWAADVLGETYDAIEEIPEIATDAFDTIETESTACRDAVKGAFSGLKKSIEKELSAQPTIKFHYKNTKTELTVSAKLATGTNDTLQGSSLGNLTIQNINVQAKASGGYVSNGQLFVAREAGPEMVGSIGNQTAVANNDQIVAGIASGVKAAESEQNALLRQQNSILMQLLNKELVISPSVALGQVVARSNALYARS